MLLKRTFETDAIKKYGQRDRLKNSNVFEESVEAVNRKAVVIAGNAGVTVPKEDIMVCYRLPTEKKATEKN